MSDLVEIKVAKQLGKIESNLEAVKSAVLGKIADYKNYVVTEDTVKDSKELLADIRKQQKALDDERKQIKKEWNGPFEEWEKKAKEVINLYDEPISIISKQLQVFEEDRRQAKRKTIVAIYEECKGELEEYLSLEKIYDARWENASYKESAIREDMQTRFAQVEMAISTIKSMEHRFEEKGLAEYKKTLDLQAAIQVMQRYQKQEEEILARQEAEKKAAEERARLEVEQEAERKAEEVASVPFPDVPFPNVTPMEEQPFALEGKSATICFVVNVPEENAAEFEAYLQNREYDFERRED